MSRVVVLGAGISGHTAASFAKRWLGRAASVTVVSPNSSYNWIPSNIWVGVGLMRPTQVTFPLAPVYERHGIEFVHAAARELHPEGDVADPTPYVTVEPTAKSGEGANARVKYDFLINATGPKLRFDKTEGLGPDGHSLSVCTVEHAVQTAAAFDEAVARMHVGERQRFLVGVGHGTCTCEGAAFEYIVNLEFELRARKVRDKADIVWITNEYELGDFGMGGMHLKHGGYVTPSNIFAASLFAERGIRWITQAHVQKVTDGHVSYETLDGREREHYFDFAMLLPPFSGVGLKAYGRDGTDITSRLFLPNDFMRVDADYSPKPFDEWKAADWPRTYQSPEYPNIFAVGIAFAPSRFDGGDGRRLRRFCRGEPIYRHGRFDDRVPYRPRLRPFPLLRPGHEAHFRGDRTGRPLDQDPLAPPVHLQGQAPFRLAAHPGVARAMAGTGPNPDLNDSTTPYVTRPTRSTVFLRTFLPWQLWRFVRINLKMMGIIRHRS